MLSGHDHVGAVRQQHDLLGRNLVDSRQQVVGRGVQRGAAVDRLDAELVEHLLQALTVDDRDRPAAQLLARRRRARDTACGARVDHSAAGAHRRELRGHAHPRFAFGHLGVHVGDIEVRNLAGRREHGRRERGLVGVQVHLQRARIADHEH